MRSIVDVAEELGLPAASLEPHGAHIAKVPVPVVSSRRRAGRLVLVSAINPAPAGEGKTTVSIGLAMGLRQLGKQVVVALREPSLGPIFGLKGGATGGGKAVLLPADDINLHFTGDLHAITAAHNLLAALVDNALHFATPCGAAGALDARQITWPRALDMNDRALRHCVVGLGRRGDGVPRQTRFDITAASEVMAILALATDAADLQARLRRIVVGQAAQGQPVTAADLQADGAMAVLLRHALKPNLVQTGEGGPALVHCGPFANIAHGCNSVLATRLGQQMADFVVTEAGFGFDLGGEKFLDLKCRSAGMWPRLVVLVASLRSLKMHGGVPLERAGEADTDGLRAGLPHLQKHLESIAAFGLPAVVAVNVFAQDRAAELDLVEAFARDHGAQAARIAAFAEGGAGGLALAQQVASVAAASDAQPPTPRFTYALQDSAEDKAHKVATALYGARDVLWTAQAQAQLARIREQGHGQLPVCMAKTPASLSDDATRRGRPRDFSITVRELRLSAGAGFLVALTGEVNTMPGLPKAPASQRLHVGTQGEVVGLG